MKADLSAGTLSSTTPAVQEALTKFLDLVDDLGAVRDLNRRVFFEFLRTRPTLSPDDVDQLWAVADLLADLDNACRN